METPLKHLLNSSLFTLVMALLSGCGGGSDDLASQRRPVPVEVAPVARGPAHLVRSLSGTLRANADFMVAAKVSGQVHELRVRISDVIEKGEVLAILDAEPFVQEVKQAEANLLVANARLAEAEAQLTIAERGMNRFRELNESGFVSESDYDAALTDQLSAEASLKVAEAEIENAEAALESARIRFSYTQVKADWAGSDPERVVAERFIDEGDSVSTNQRMFRVVDPDPLLAVVYVTENDYPLVQVGDAVSIYTDVYPDSVFEGEVIRVAPVFSELSRQAMVELQIANEDGALRPGMFVRAELVLEEKPDAQMVPLLAIVRRDDQDGVFVVDDSGESVSWQAVETGILEDDRIEIISPELAGSVVTLGQQLLEDGSSIIIRED